MESLSRINYNLDKIADMEPEVSYTVKQTISQGINDGGVLSFRLPPDSERFTDLNTLILRLEVGIKTAKGTDVDATKVVCLEPGGMYSLFSSCEVRFNEDIVSTMTSYPYTTTLSRYLGCAKEIRDGVMDTLDGTYPFTQDYSKVDTGENSKAMMKKRRSRIEPGSVLVGRIYSDILTSSRQYLPPGMSLGIDLRRAPDAFSLLSPEATDNYKIVITSASIYARRHKLIPKLVPHALESVKNGGVTFNRLETRLTSIKQGVYIFRWNDCLNGAPLPNRFYIGFVAQKSLYGDLGQLSSYFETLNMESLNLKLNGRDLLIEPIQTSFPRDATTGKLKSETDATEGFLSIAEVMGIINDQTQSLRLNYSNYLQGMTIYAVELGKCGEKSGSSGYVDLELTFGEGGAELDACCLIFTEKTEHALFNSN